ncbi:MAG TPA: biopolymer transporter ExbD [Steroidobacteraceae bacterium]|jgi:biopolymer transport protein ExbD
MMENLVRALIRAAARNAPPHLTARLEEEWLAAMLDRSGVVSRLKFGMGCCWAAVVIAREPHLMPAPAAALPTTGRPLMTARSVASVAGLPRRSRVPTRDTVLCDINTTPLIDVMLVLLVTLIVSLPLVTHAVKLDLPQKTPPTQGPRPEVIDLAVDFDGTIVWNGTAVAGLGQLEEYFRAEAQRVPQPEVHLRPDARAKYDIVAKVLAAAQRNRMQRIGVVDVAKFTD